MFDRVTLHVSDLAASRRFYEELLGTLGCAPRPFAQALDLARLREVEQREDGKPRDRHQTGHGADVRQRPAEREREHEIHQVLGV